MAVVGDLHHDSTEARSGWASCWLRFALVVGSPESRGTAMEPYIDAHSHIWTPDVAHYPLAPGSRSPTCSRDPSRPRSCWRVPAGGGRPRQPDPDELLRFDNSLHARHDQAVPRPFRRHGDRRPVGRRSGESDAGTVEAGRHPRSGIQPQVTGKQPPARWLEPAGYAAMFATAAQTGQALSCLIDSDGFPEVDRMCRRFPDTTVIIDHLGRIGAGPDGAIRDADVEALSPSPSTARSRSRSGRSTPWARRRPPISTSFR